MIATKWYGFTPEMIDWSSPSDMKPYIKAHKEGLKEKDYIAWLQGQYALSAASVAIERCLAGRRAKTKYIKKPILQEMEEQSKPMTEEEIQRQRELFVAKLQAMKTNFELNN